MISVELVYRIFLFVKRNHFSSWASYENEKYGKENFSILSQWWERSERKISKKIKKVPFLLTFSMIVLTCVFGAPEGEADLFSFKQLSS